MFWVWTARRKTTKRYVYGMITSASSGVPTTLVLDGTTGELHPGSCFDHIAIKTNSNVAEISKTLDGMDCKIFMKSTEMLGRQVMGVVDPNGYKFVLAGI
jgi:hypothetical protein